MTDETHTHDAHDTHAQNETEQVKDDITASEVTGDEARARLKELVEEIDIAAFTTCDATGNLVCRPMSTREVDEAGDIWFEDGLETPGLALLRVTPVASEY